MNKNPKISIITVAFNSVKTIQDTIVSILLQDYKNIEYIIIDAGSSDGTVEIIKSFGDKITYFISESDHGIYDGMNKGIKAAAGDLIGILNSDDFYPNNFILSNVRYWQAGDYSAFKIKNGWMLPHPTFFVKKSIYDRFGLYNTELKRAADYEMILKLLYKQNISVKYIPMILVNMRMGGASNSSLINRIKANKEDGLAWTKNQLNKPMFIRIKKPLQKVRQFFLKPKI